VVVEGARWASGRGRMSEGEGGGVSMSLPLS